MGVYPISTLQLPTKDTAVGGVDAEGFADELGEVGSCLVVIHHAGIGSSNSYIARHGKLLPADQR
jgi:hypothetical protein